MNPRLNPDLNPDLNPCMNLGRARAAFPPSAGTRAGTAGREARP